MSFVIEIMERNYEKIDGTCFKDVKYSSANTLFFTKFAKSEKNH